MIDSAGFHSDMVWSNMTAIINPGYPHIAMPESAWEDFKKDVLDFYPGEPVTCRERSWCYFFTTCDDLKKRMPDLNFSFKANDGETVTYSVPPKSYLYPDVDYRTNLTICHVGITAQRYKDVNYWMLGGPFMENFYVTYDATDPEQLKVGISANEADPVSTIIFVVAFATAGAIFSVFIGLGICLCMR